MSTPDYPTVKPPQDYGKSTADYLLSFGYATRIPSIRSSDAGYLSDPFSYYLRRRLGLGTPTLYSKALSRGSWFHTALELGAECNYAIPLLRTLYAEQVESRIEELQAIYDAQGIIGDKRQDLLYRQRQDAQTALAWFIASMDVKPPGLPNGWTAYLLTPQWKHLGSEIRLSYKDPNYSGTPLVAQLDQLLYNSETNKLWILDAKTTALDAEIRAQSCSVSYQTWHYLHILSNMLPAIIAKYDLPSDVEVGGMMHLVIAKPGIEFGSRDRPYIWHSDGKGKKLQGTVTSTSEGYTVNVESYLGDKLDPVHEPTLEDGLATLHKMTGKKPAKVYNGEPDVHLYEQRCRDWYCSTGDYASEEETRHASPPIIMSFTSMSVFDSRTLKEYHAITSRLNVLATQAPHPELFYRTESGMTDFGKISTFSPFYVSHPELWPTIIRQNNLVQYFREDDPVEVEITDSPSPS